MQLEPMGPGNGGKTRGFRSPVPGLARQDAVGQVFGPLWYQTGAVGGFPGPVANTSLKSFNYHGNPG